jgi:hypothetical protein
MSSKDNLENLVRSGGLKARSRRIARSAKACCAPPLTA